tara:strand:- start:158 stop:814 length:657 start_codon:yes stop_codon:yes gene_type:complete
MNFSKFEKIIGIKFENKKILKQSLTHKSYSSIKNNEKLEFLGDRVLGLIISKKLYELYPNDSEGNLDKKLSGLVNKNICCEIGKKISIDEFIIINSPKKKINLVDKIISDSCEALIGAIYLEHGFATVEKFIVKLWKNYLNKSIKIKIDPKTMLQEYSLKKYKSLPVYKLLATTGPKHKPLFNVSVKVRNSKIFNAIGNSKKDAEQKAAKNFLKEIVL